MQFATNEENLTVTAPPLESNPLGQSRLEGLINSVFNVDLLRELILAQVINSEIRRGRSRDDLRSIRQVAKSWLIDAARYLKKIHQPLYHISLTKENSLNDSPYNQLHSKKLLDHFISSITSPTGLEASIPPFSLKISIDFFREENHSSFKTFLQKCSSGLVNLELSIPCNGASMTYIFPNKFFNFPQLQKVTVRYSVEEILEEGETPSTSVSNSECIYLIHPILTGARNLKKLEFPGTRDPIPSPRGMRYLKFPPTITTLDLNCIIKGEQLEVLLDNELPHLRTLKFRIVHLPYSEDLVSKILEKFRRSLEHLDISGWTFFSGPPTNPTVVRFPVMEKLRFCGMFSPYVDLELDQPPLQSCLPKLTGLSLHNQRVGMFQKWTGYSVLKNVTKLNITLIRDDIERQHEMDPGTSVILNLERMKALHLTFPNVKSLGVTVSSRETSGLKYLFLEMTKLKNLNLVVLDGGEYSSSDFWDALLIGAPAQMVASLQENPDSWPNFQLNDDSHYPSIRRLKSLESLTLVAPPANAGPSLISNVAFHLALLKMESLKHLYLGGQFEVSPEMQEVWKSGGRSINWMMSRR